MNNPVALSWLPSPSLDPASAGTYVLHSAHNSSARARTRTRHQVRIPLHQQSQRILTHGIDTRNSHTTLLPAHRHTNIRTHTRNRTLHFSADASGVCTGMGNAIVRSLRKPQGGPQGKTPTALNTVYTRVRARAGETDRERESERETRGRGTLDTLKAGTRALAPRKNLPVCAHFAESDPELSFSYVSTPFFTTFAH